MCGSVGEIARQSIARPPHDGAAPDYTMPMRNLLFVGFHVAGFGSAVLGAIVYAVISWAASALVFGGKKQ